MHDGNDSDKRAELAINAAERFIQQPTEYRLNDREKAIVRALHIKILDMLLKDPAIQVSMMIAFNPENGLNMQRTHLGVKNICPCVLFKMALGATLSGFEASPCEIEEVNYPRRQS